MVFQTNDFHLKLEYSFFPYTYKFLYDSPLSWYFLTFYDLARLEGDFDGIFFLLAILDANYELNISVTELAYKRITERKWFYYVYSGSVLFRDLTTYI